MAIVVPPCTGSRASCPQDCSSARSQADLLFLKGVLKKQLLKAINENNFAFILNIFADAPRGEEDVAVDILPLLEKLTPDTHAAAICLLQCVRFVEPITGPVLPHRRIEEADILASAVEAHAEIRRIAEALKRSNILDIRTSRNRAFLTAAGIDCERVKADAAYRNDLVNRLSDRELFFLVKHSWDNHKIFYPWFEDLEIRPMSKEVIDVGRMVFRSLLIRQLSTIHDQ